MYSRAVNLFLYPFLYPVHYKTVILSSTLPINLTLMMVVSEHQAPGSRLPYNKDGCQF